MQHIIHKYGENYAAYIILNPKIDPKELTVILQYPRKHETILRVNQLLLYNLHSVQRLWNIVREKLRIILQRSTKETILQIKNLS